MSKIIKACVASAIFAVAGMAHAEKVAVLSPQQAMLETELAKKRLKSLEDQPEFRSARSNAENLEKEVRALIEGYQKDQSVLSDSQKKAEEGKIRAKREALDKAIQKLQQVQAPVAQKLMQELGPKFRDAVRDVVKEKGITILLDRQVAIIADPSSDITSDVTVRLNKAQ